MNARSILETLSLPIFAGVRQLSGNWARNSDSLWRLLLFILLKSLVRCCVPQPWPLGSMGAGTAPASRVLGHSATALLAAAAVLTPIDDGVVSMIASLNFLYVPAGGLCLTQSFMIFMVFFGGLGAVLVLCCYQGVQRLCSSNGC